MTKKLNISKGSVRQTVKEWTIITLGVLLFGLGRADLNNQLFVSWRQIACMLHMIASGILLYPFRKQAPARAGA